MIQYLCKQLENPIINNGVEESLATHTGFTNSPWVYQYRCSSRVTVLECKQK